MAGAYRCGVVGAEALDPMLDQLVASGLVQFRKPFALASAALPWEERNTSLIVWVWPVLPSGEPGCDALQ